MILRPFKGLFFIEKEVFYIFMANYNNRGIKKGDKYGNTR